MPQKLLINTLKMGPESHIKILDGQVQSEFADLSFRKQNVYLIFCINDSVVFKFSPAYSRQLNPGRAFIIYDPDKDVSFQLILNENTKICILETEITSMHRLFVSDTNMSSILNPQFSQKKFYEEREFPVEIISIITQLSLTKLTDLSKKLFQQAKSLEIISIFFGTLKPSSEACPFLNNDEIVKKIKRAKDLLIDNFNKGITLSEVSKKIGINENQLKLGFKEIYNNTPYQYLLDYKLEIANQLLLKEQLQVSEVAYQIGYSNISHFIAAYKKKFGTTPKKQIKNK